MKIQRISQFQLFFNFPNYNDHYDQYIESFRATDLGRIYTALPWQELVSSLGLKDSKKGPTSLFSPQGKLGLMFLKHYACCSDKKLIEQLNGNIYYQLFCDVWIGPSQSIKNFKIVSEIRCEIARCLDIDKIQKVLAQHWNPYCEDLGSVLFDATCYESSIRYPTDVKLLWESVSWSHSQLKSISKQAGIRLIRTKIIKWTKRYVNYSKMRRKTKKKRISLTRGLLRLLEKINTELRRLEELGDYKVVQKYSQRRETIKKVLEQQKIKFHQGINPSHRIVSIDKPYIRPIVRGKEIKKVEFGAKVHKLQIDGISYIEHLDFEAFNEGTRLEKTIFKAQQMTHRKVKIIGADAIYATNKNRRKLTADKIQSDFKRKGRAGKHETERMIMAKMITKERASRLEGSFGTDKEYFLLNKIKARTKETEILWIFLGIHTSNALNIGRRIAKNLTKAA